MTTATSKCDYVVLWVIAALVRQFAAKNNNKVNFFFGDFIEIGDAEKTFSRSFFPQIKLYALNDAHVFIFMSICLIISSLRSRVNLIESAANIKKTGFSSRQRLVTDVKFGP